MKVRIKLNGIVLMIDDAKTVREAMLAAKRQRISGHGRKRVLKGLWKEQLSGKTYGVSMTLESGPL